MAAQERNDARTAAWLLASTAKECLEHPDKGPAHAVVLNNVYRLIQSYRVNTFFGLEPADIHHGPSKTISVVPPREHHVRAVRDVLDRALAKVFSGQSKQEALTEIETVLKCVAYPDSGDLSDAAKARATSFFSEMVEHL